ncbi:MAG: T9SS type A sorting domain-containing protein [Bacteroidales bacterium]|nr:T9SS type A sorting domain-containing protein [Bacteroidales bacterium]
MKKTIHTLFLAVFTLGLFAQTDILPPALVSPTNGKAHQMPDVNLDWNAVSGVGLVTYQIHVDTNDQFTDPFVFMVNVTSVKMENLLFGTLYYWKVRATDNTGTSDWSEVFSFSTFDEVLLQGPNAGATDQVPNVKLQWKKQASQGVPMSGITYYEYQISEDPDFAGAPVHQVSFSSFGSTESFHYGYASQLRFNTVYYWRVRAKHDLDITEWSEVRDFTTLEKVTLTAPSDNATEQMLDVNLEWTAVTGTFGYLYELCTDPAFSFPCMSVTDTNIIVPQVLDFGETYYWRVKTYHNIDTTGWSDTWSFETINTVYPVSPANGALIENILPKLTWQPITGINKYEVLYDVTNTFTNPEGGIIGPASPEYQIQFVLEFDVTYYWKVRAIQDGDTTNWSATWSFTPHMPSASGEGILVKSNINVFPNPSVGNLSVTINTRQTAEVLIKVYDLLGQVFYEETFAFAPDRNRNDLDLTALPKGMYIISFTHGERVYNEKLIIRK